MTKSVKYMMIFLHVTVQNTAEVYLELETNAMHKMFEPTDETRDW